MNPVYEFGNTLLRDVSMALFYLREREVKSGRWLGLDDCSSVPGKGKTFLFATTVPGPAVGPTQFRIQWIPEAVSVSIVSRLWAGWSEFDSRHWQGSFLFATASKPALVPIQPTIEWVPVTSAEIKLPGLETDHSPPYSDEVKNAWSYTSTRPIRLHDVVLCAPYRGSFLQW
jgi:hypothetical protein